jgi:hypothetical protein
MSNIKMTGEKSEDITINIGGYSITIKKNYPSGNESGDSDIENVNGGITQSARRPSQATKAKKILNAKALTEVKKYARKQMARRTHLAKRIDYKHDDDSSEDEDQPEKEVQVKAKSGKRRPKSQLTDESNDDDSIVEVQPSCSKREIAKRTSTVKNYTEPGDLDESEIQAVESDSDDPVVELKKKSSIVVKKRAVAPAVETSDDKSPAEAKPYAKRASQVTKIVYKDDSSNDSHENQVQPEKEAQALAKAKSGKRAKSLCPMNATAAKTSQARPKRQRVATHEANTDSEGVVEVQASGSRRNTAKRASTAVATYNEAPDSPDLASETASNEPEVELAGPAKEKTTVTPRSAKKSRQSNGASSKKTPVVDHGSRSSPRR